MTKKEFFGLRFYKVQSSLGNSLRSICTRDEVHIYSYLTFLTYMDQNETTFLLCEINNALNGFCYDTDYLSDGTGVEKIRIVPPNIIIGPNCVISLFDMKALLNEWLFFITSSDTED